MSSTRSLSQIDLDRLSRQLGVDLGEPLEADQFEAMIQRYGDRMVAALDEGWFDDRPVSRATAVEYRRKYTRFERWVARFGLSSLPAYEETVEVFAQYRLESGVKASSIGRELDAIDWMHRRECLSQPGQTPRLKEWKKGALRHPDQKPPRQSYPLSPDDVWALSRAVKLGAVDWERCRPGRNGLKRLRTVALFLFLFGTGIRISDAVRLEASWVVIDPGGWARIEAPRSKNHPQGTTYLMYPASDARWCPVRALIAWISAANEAGGLPNGRLFAQVNPREAVLTDPLDGVDGDDLWVKVSHRVSAENFLLRAAAEQSGIDWDPSRYAISTRSFRRGLATAAHQAGAEISRIQRTLCHRLHATTARYIETVTRAADDTPASLVLG